LFQGLTAENFIPFIKSSPFPQTRERLRAYDTLRLPFYVAVHITLNAFTRSPTAIANKCTLIYVQSKSAAPTM